VGQQKRVPKFRNSFCFYARYLYQLYPTFVAMFDLVVIGGGAAGFFGAINFAEQRSDARVLILEKAARVLQKVKISGGGRCNVTHACFDPQELAGFYPRGEKELLGPFHKFMTYDTIAWFSERGVELKTEEDGRMFPVTDNSQTIIDCFTKALAQNNIKLNTECGVKKLYRHNDYWQLELQDGNKLEAKNVLMAAGSSPAIWDMLAALGHKIEPPVPSLFTFNIKDSRIEGLMGISVPLAEVAVNGTKLTESGPLLITHWGMSGPAILKLSAWGARALYGFGYKFSIRVNFVASYAHPEEELEQLRKNYASKKVTNRIPFGLPQRLWNSIITHLGIEEKNYGDLSAAEWDKIFTELTAGEYSVNGKSTFKDEFVTCGGVLLKEIDMRTMESRLHKGLYFAGEVMDIDAVTGGFNFQAAWTTSYIAAQAMLERG
jgi:predicted Rossmann fold flavoprotein